jgi:hypothetical protein
MERRLPTPKDNSAPSICRPNMLGLNTCEIGSAHGCFARPVASLGSSLAQQPSSSQLPVLADGVGAKPKRVDGMHQVRFIEIFIAGRRVGTEIS